jgi:hypothetical protein
MLHKIEFDKNRKLIASYFLVRGELPDDEYSVVSNDKVVHSGIIVDELGFNHARLIKFDPSIKLCKGEHIQFIVLGIPDWRSV